MRVHPVHAPCTCCRLHASSCFAKFVGSSLQQVTFLQPACEPWLSFWDPVLTNIPILAGFELIVGRNQLERALSVHQIFQFILVFLQILFTVFKPVLVTQTKHSSLLESFHEIILLHLAVAEVDCCNLYLRYSGSSSHCQNHYLFSSDAFSYS